MSNIKLELQNFRTPNFVLIKPKVGKREDGFKGEGLNWALKELPAETLSDLCDTFRSDIFEKAGKHDPKK